MVLRRLRRLAPHKANDFNLSTSEQIVGTVDRVGAGIVLATDLGFLYALSRFAAKSLPRLDKLQDPLKEAYGTLLAWWRAQHRALKQRSGKYDVPEIVSGHLNCVC